MVCGEDCGFVGRIWIGMQYIYQYLNHTHKALFGRMVRFFEIPGTSRKIHTFTCLWKRGMWGFGGKCNGWKGLGGFYVSTGL